MVAGDDAIVRVLTTDVSIASTKIRALCAPKDTDAEYGFGQIIRVFDVTDYSHFKTLSRHVLFSHGQWNVVRLPERMLYKSAVDKSGNNKLKSKLQNCLQLLSELAKNPVTLILADVIMASYCVILPRPVE
jgi:hypothetical protein